MPLQLVPGGSELTALSNLFSYLNFVTYTDLRSGFYELARHLNGAIASTRAAMHSLIRISLLHFFCQLPLPLPIVTAEDLRTVIVNLR